MTKIQFLTRNSVFDNKFSFWQQVQFLTKKSKFNKKSIFDNKFNFSQKIKFWQKFNFWQQIQFLTTNSIFDNKFNYWQKNNVWQKIQLLTKNQILKTKILDKKIVFIFPMEFIWILGQKGTHKNRLCRHRLYLDFFKIHVFSKIVPNYENFSEF